METKKTQNDRKIYKKSGESAWRKRLDVIDIDLLLSLKGDLGFTVSHS